MKTPKTLVPVYLVAIAISIYLLPYEHAVAETLAANGFEMHYTIIGKGEPLVLLHGFAQSGESWDFLSDEFAKQFRLIIPDARGHGRSTNPGNTSIANDQLAVDTYALLDDLEIKSFKAIGVSMGGETLLYMATQQPDRVDRMVLVGTASYWPESMREFVRSSAPDSLPLKQMEELRKIHQHGDDQIYSLFKLNAIAKENYEVMNLTPPYLSTIKADTLIVHGERDHLFPINMAIEMYKAIPESRLWIVPNGGHVPIKGFYEKTFVDTAKAFLQGNMAPK